MTLWTAANMFRGCLARKNYAAWSRLQMIRKKSARREKNVRCEKLARKKGTHEIMRKLTTHVSQLYYFLVQLNFIPYRAQKFLCLVHNYRFYRKMVWDERHEKFVSWSSINNTHVSCIVCFLHLTDFSRIVCSRVHSSYYFLIKYFLQGNPFDFSGF